MSSSLGKTTSSKDPSAASAKPKTSNRLGLIASVLVAVGGLLLAVQTPIFSARLPFFGSSGSEAFVDVLDTANGVTYRGLRRNAVEDFQNIFYAQDTSGKNRFAPPVPHVPAKGSIIDATHEGAWCPQGKGPVLPFTSIVANTSENCLSVRITRPAHTKSDANLPVVVWLHGGGHALGSTSDILYTPVGFIEQSVSNSQPLVFVGVNYRLGFFGFAASKALSSAKHTNVGLRDQRAAFEWVKKNIASFGGDPSRVTAMGQSVGGSDIGFQLTAFGGKKGAPFDKAIMMSGAPGLNFDTKGDAVVQRTALVAEQVGCVKGGDAQGEDTLACLRETPWEMLANKSVDMMRAARPPFGEAFFHPTYDNDFIPGFPSELMRAGKFVKNVPLIVSWVQNEGAWYQLPTTSSDDEVKGAVSLWMNGLAPDSLDELLELYPLSDFQHNAPEGSPINAQYYRAARMSRDLWFTCPAIDFSWQYARSSGADLVRLYEFNQTRFQPVWEMMGVPFWGVGHLSDIPYALNVKELPAGVDSSTVQLELARRTSSKIIAFVSAQDTKIVDSALKDWTPAYSSHAQDSLENEAPSSVSIKILGGPHDGSLTYNSRSQAAETGAEDAIAAEKLFARCDFINSARVRKEIGV